MKRTTATADLVSDAREIAQQTLELGMFSWVGHDNTSMELVPGKSVILSALYDRAKVIRKGIE